MLAQLVNLAGLAVGGFGKGGRFIFLHIFSGRRAADQFIQPQPFQPSGLPAFHGARLQFFQLHFIKLVLGPVQGNVDFFFQRSFQIRTNFFFIRT